MNGSQEALQQAYTVAGIDADGASRRQLYGSPAGEPYVYASPRSG